MFATLLRIPSIVSSGFRLFLFSGFLMFFLFGTGKARAQVNNYSFTTTTGNVLESGGFSNLLGTLLDDNVSAVTSIGFTFRYGGANYTTFSATSNGLIQLGGSANADYDNITNNLYGPYLMPYWDDNYTDVDGNVEYKLMGSAGSRKLVIDFNLSYLGNTGTADKHFQVWLFETTNRVQFVYGNGNDQNGGFSVGILTDGTNDFVSVNTGTNTSSIVTPNDNNTTWPGSGRAYSFVAGSTLPVSLLSFSGYRDGNRNQLQWSTATEINNRGFELQRSADGNNFATIGFINTLAAGGNSSSQLSYRFTDNNVSGNKFYYRLRQVDIDGKSKLSSMVVINGPKVSAVQLEGIFPNPAVSTLNLQISSPADQTLKVIFYDLSGKIALQKPVALNAGNNVVMGDISLLKNGFYWLKLENSYGENCGTMKISVLK